MAVMAKVALAAAITATSREEAGATTTSIKSSLLDIEYL
jgi:hypothetical protein